MEMESENGNAAEAAQAAPAKPSFPKKFIMLAIASIVLGAFVVAGVVYLLPAPAGQQNNGEVGLSDKEYNGVLAAQTGGTRIPTGAERLERRYSMDRGEYDIYMDGHGYKTFAYLPDVPENFGTISYQVSTGKLFDLSKVTRDYYLQPEFYPLFADNGLPFYENYDPKYVGVFGWGTYPSEQWADAVAGSSADVEFFFKTGWGVETWQGMNLKATPKCNWVQASITDSLFITAPSYPEFCTVQHCGGDWARKMAIHLEVSGSALKGQKCDIELSNTAPPKENSIEWGDRYDVSYIAASKAMVTAGVPFVVHLTVVEGT